MASLSAAGTAPTTPTSAAGGNQARESAFVVQQARQFLGTPYVWGGESTKGVDCSGLLQFIWGKAGVAIPRTTYDQFTAGQPVAAGQLRPGDAVFFRGSDPRGGLPGHVGIYIGGGKIIEAPHTGANVRVSSLAGRTDFAGARRYGVGTVPSPAVAAATTPHAAAAGLLPGPSQANQGAQTAALKAILAQQSATLRAPSPTVNPGFAALPTPTAPVLAARQPLALLNAPTQGPLAALASIR